jgi:hypothetical protein
MEIKSSILVRHFFRLSQLDLHRSPERLHRGVDLRGSVRDHVSRTPPIVRTNVTFNVT